MIHKSTIIRIVVSVKETAEQTRRRAHTRADQRTLADFAAGSGQGNGARHWGNYYNWPTPQVSRL